MLRSKSSPGVTDDSPARRSARARRPNPFPVRASHSRRERGSEKLRALVDINEFITAEQHVRKVAPRAFSFCARRLGEQSTCNLEFLSSGRTCKRKLIRRINTRDLIIRRLSQQSFRQMAGASLN